MDISKLRPDNVVTTDKSADNKRAREKTGVSQIDKAVDAATSAPLDNAKSTSHHDRVKWSPDSEAIREGVQAAKNAPDTRAEKIELLKEQIKAGKYKTDSKAIAEKMIQQSLEDDILTRQE